MTVDVRSLVGGLPTVFDLDSQTGILFLLRAIRAADIPPADKNQLKDLVFLYNTGGKDAAVKNKLAEMLLTKAVTPESVLLEVSKIVITEPVSATSATTAGFAEGRPVPLFIVPTLIVEKNAAVLSDTKIASDVAIVPKIEVITPTPPTVTSLPVEKIITVVPTSVGSGMAVVAKPVVAMVETPVPVANNIELTIKSPFSENTPTPIHEPAPEVAVERLERIRVIKSDVNARVGNPVNLVDVDNALGREYMSALLEAMKLLSSAGALESAQAMDRLETVYKQVLVLLTAKENETTPPPLAVVPIEEVMPEVETVPAPEIVPIAHVPVPAPVDRAVPVIVMATPAPTTDFAMRSKVTDKPVATPEVSHWGATDATKGSVEVVPNVSQAVTPRDTITVARLSTPPAEPLRSVVNPVVPIYQPEITAAVSTATPLRAITELPTADEVSAFESMGSNPLYTKDVDAGLDQLLGEWAMFKKSGLFGTGPKGREHPLYTKISPLQVPLILSGRFEGSTQEIKQSITDYMNGWRYEQGIIYEANETLDQYLRRVIRHIIDLQKTKPRS